MSTGAADLLPAWAAHLWTIVCLAVAVAHVRHLLGAVGQRRAWHGAHVATAIGMAVMYSPAQLDPAGVPSGVWQAMFGAAAAAPVLWMTVATVVRRDVDALWALTALDLMTMSYMWRADGGPSAFDWLLAVAFALQAVLWAAGVIAPLAGRAARVRGITLSVGAPADTSVLTPALAPRLAGHMDLRASMTAMTLGMAYMLAALALAH